MFAGRGRVARLTTSRVDFLDVAPVPVGIPP